MRCKECGKKLTLEWDTFNGRYYYRQHNHGKEGPDQQKNPKNHTKEPENWISTTIKRKWMDKILEGKKIIEYKKSSDFWVKRLSKYVGPHQEEGDLGINFLCGRKAYKYAVFGVERVQLGQYEKPLKIDADYVDDYFAIHLDYRLKELENFIDDRKCKVNGGPE